MKAGKRKGAGGESQREEATNLAATRAGAPAVGTARGAGPRRLRRLWIGRSRASSTRPSQTPLLGSSLPSPPLPVHPPLPPFLFFFCPLSPHRSKPATGGGWVHDPDLLVQREGMLHWLGARGFLGVDGDGGSGSARWPVGLQKKVAAD